MKKTKKYLAIKIMCFALSGLLLSSSVFVSGAKTMTVQAETNEGDLTASILYFIISVLGAVARKDPISLMNAGASGANLISTITNYVKDNGDGTYTIDEELIQAVNEIICKDYIDGQVEPDENGFYNYGAFSYDFHIVYGGVFLDYFVTSTAFQYDTPLVMVINETTCKMYQLRKDVFSYANSFPSKFTGNTGSSTFYRVGTYNNEQKLTGHSLKYIDSPQQPFTADNATEYVVKYSVPFPVFSDVTTAENALRSGDYKDAINYREKTFEVSSRFTGNTYNGGDITVTFNKLSGIEDKINELEESDMSTDEKVDELNDWLRDDIDNGIDDGIGNGTGGIGDITVSGGDSGDSGTTGGNGLGGFLNGLGSIGDAILSILGKLLEYIGKALELFTDTITKVLDIIPKGFTGLLTALFPFVPQEWIVAIELTLVLGIVLMIVKAFRK